MKKLFNKFFSNYQKTPGVLMNKVRKILESSGREAFLLILVFILSSIILGEFLLYKYIFLTEIKNSSIPSPLVEFNKKTYESVLKEWQDRENIFNGSMQENYQDPFK